MIKQRVAAKTKAAAAALDSDEEEKKEIESYNPELLKKRSGVSGGDPLSINEKIDAIGLSRGQSDVHEKVAASIDHQPVDFNTILSEAAAGREVLDDGSDEDSEDLF